MWTGVQNIMLGMWMLSVLAPALADEAILARGPIPNRRSDCPFLKQLQNFLRPVAGQAKDADEKSEAESDQNAADATLRELVQLWSTLDEAIRQAIVTIARTSSA